MLEMIGPGKGGQGAEWVAVRVPDGQISCHANKARIGEFPLEGEMISPYGELHLLRERHLVRDREGLLRPEVRAALPLLRRVLPAHAEEPALRRTLACGA